MPKNDLILNIIEPPSFSADPVLTHPRLFKQTQENSYTVYFHPIAGVLNTKALQTLIDLLKGFTSPTIHLSFSGGLYVLHLSGNEANQLLIHTQAIGAESPFEQSTACIGLPLCRQATVNVQATLNHILAFFKSHHVKKTYLPKMHFIGCAKCSYCIHPGELYVMTQNDSSDPTPTFSIYFYQEDTPSSQFTLGTFKQKDLTTFFYRLHQLLLQLGMPLSQALDTHREELETFLAEYRVNK